MDILCDTSFQPPFSGARRSLAEQYYHTLDFTNAADVKRVLRAFEAVLQNIDHTRKLGQTRVRLLFPSDLSVGL